MTPDLITSDPEIMLGKPVVRGTRITVELILEKLAAGESVDQMLAAHPRLTMEGIRAALAFALQTLRSEVVVADGSVDGATVARLRVAGQAWDIGP